MTQKVAFNFDPFDMLGIDKPADKDQARAIAKSMAEYVLTQVVQTVGDGRSPVAGGSWKRSLSKDYKAAKVKQGGNPYADMILYGDLLTNLDCVVTRDGNLELRNTGKEAAKADGHNNFSGKSSLPLREYIPKEGQTFKRDIMAGLRAIAEEAIANGNSQ